MTIPIKNVYYLFLYAWDQFDIGKNLGVASFEGTNPLNLLSKVLCDAVRIIEKHGIQQEYQTLHEVGVRPRGKLDINETIRSGLTPLRKLAYDTDELTSNNKLNQLIKSTLQKVRQDAAIDKPIRLEADSLLKRLSGIDLVELRSETFSRIKLHSNNRYYKLALNVCQLLYETAAPEAGGTTSLFSAYLNDERKMATVFEAFVRNFYKAEQNEFAVKAEEIPWGVELNTDQSLLPRMRTDITLQSETRRIIIDTKYYKTTLQSHHGTDKIHSSNIYQLMSYLTNDQVNSGQVASGMLLYPTVQQAVDVSYTLLGHRVSIKTINLAQDWADIRENLLEYVL